MCCVCEINGDTRTTLLNTPPPLSPSQTPRPLWICCLAEGNGDTSSGTAVRNCSQQPSAIVAYHTLKCCISPLLSSCPEFYREAQRRTFSKMLALVQLKVSRVAISQENAPSRFQLCQHCRAGLMRRDTLNCLKCKYALHFLQSV